MTGRDVNMTEHSNSTKGAWSAFLVVRLVSGVVLVLLAVVTVFSNVVLLATLWRKRKRSRLKTPTLYFVLGLGVADLTAGLVVEPAFSVCYLGDLSTCRAEMELIQFLPPLVMNSSFLIVLFLSWSQYLAISHPHAFKRLVTKRRVTTVVAGVFIYATAFSLLQFTQISRRFLLAFDVCFHATFIPFLLLMSYMMVLANLRKHMRSRQAVLFRRSNYLLRGDSQVSIYFKCSPHLVERQFIRMNLMLTVVLFVCTLPSIVVMHVALNTTDATFEQQTVLSIAQKITDVMFFTKFAFDPFIFAWNVERMGTRLSLRKAFWRNSSATIARASE